MVILVKIAKIGLLQLDVKTREPITHSGCFRLKHLTVTNEGHAHAHDPGIAIMRMHKKLLFSISALLDQRFLQLINKALINCKERLTRKKNVCMIPELLNGYGNISPFLYLL